MTGRTYLEALTPGSTRRRRTRRDRRSTPSTNGSTSCRDSETAARSTPNVTGPKQPRSWPSTQPRCNCDLETVVEVAAEKNSTLVLPFPVELLRFLERATPQGSGHPDKAATTSADVASDPNGKTPELSAPKVPDDARGLELHTRIADTFQRDQ